MGLRGVAAIITLCALSTAAATAEISVQDASLSVVDSGGRLAASAELAFPAKGEAGLRLDHTQTLKLAFTVVSKADASELVRPQQAFLHLISPSGDAAYFAALKTKDGGLAVSVTSASIQKQIGTHSGVYTAALLLGGTDIANPTEWELASVEVLHPPQDDGEQPPDTPLHATEALYAPKREIRHVHRQPERRTSAIVSLVFTGITLLPLGAFIVVLASLGANVKGLPTSGAAALWTLGFWGGIAANLGLLVLFWLKLNLLQLIPLLVILTPFTSVCGSKALSAVAATRKKQE